MRYTGTPRHSSHGNAIVPFHLRSNFRIGQIGCSYGNGTIAHQFCFLFRQERNRSIDTFSICLFRRERKRTITYRSTFRITFLVVPFFGTERFYLKRFRLNTTIQRSTFRTNTERSGTIAFPYERGLSKSMDNRRIYGVNTRHQYMIRCSRDI